jgi:hypothetical protein
MSLLFDKLEELVDARIAEESGDEQFEALVELLTRKELEPAQTGSATRHSEAAGGWEIDEGHTWPTIMYYIGYPNGLTEAEGKKLYKVGWRNKPLSRK